MSNQLSEFAQRLNHAVREKGGLSAVAAGTDVPLSTLARWVRAESEPSAFKLAAIARFCGVTVEELVYGLAAFPKLEAGLIVTAQNRQTNVAAARQSDSDVEGGDDVVFIPLLDVVASAGPGIENPFPDAIDHLPFPKRWLDELGVPESFARLLELGGDSMEPTIRDRSICLLDTRFHTPRVEGIYALIDGKDVRIKRIGRGWEGKVVLISDNERYDSETLAGPDAEALRIAGKIVWAGGKL